MRGVAAGWDDHATFSARALALVASSAPSPDSAWHASNFLARHCHARSREVTRRLYPLGREYNKKTIYLHSESSVTKSYRVDAVSIPGRTRSCRKGGAASRRRVPSNLLHHVSNRCPSSSLDSMWTTAVRHAPILGAASHLASLSARGVAEASATGVALLSTRRCFP